MWLEEGFGSSRRAAGRRFCTPRVERHIGIRGIGRGVAPVSIGGSPPCLVGVTTQRKTARAENRRGLARECSLHDTRQLRCDRGGIGRRGRGEAEGSQAAAAI